MIDQRYMWSKRLMMEKLCFFYLPRISKFDPFIKRHLVSWRTSCEPIFLLHKLMKQKFCFLKKKFSMVQDCARLERGYYSVSIYWIGIIRSRSSQDSMFQYFCPLFYEKFVHTEVGSHLTIDRQFYWSFNFFFWSYNGRISRSNISNVDIVCQPECDLWDCQMVVRTENVQWLYGSTSLWIG